MNKFSKKNDPLKEKSFQFAVRIVRLSGLLSKDRGEYVISKQLLKSGTNPGAMVREAANAESGLDFIHKLSVAQKEIGETQYWLELLYASEMLNSKEFNSIYADTEEIMKLLRSSILTKKKSIAVKTSILLVLVATTFFCF